MPPKPKIPGIRVYFNICTAHLVHRISYILEHTMKIKKSMKIIFLYKIARLVQCAVFDKFKQLFIALSMVCLAKSIYPEIQQYIAKIENAIKFKVNEIDDEFDYFVELDEELTNAMRDGNNYKSKSPFGRYFNNLLKNVKKK